MRRLVIGMWAAAVLLAGTGPATAEEPAGTSSPAAAFDSFSILAQSQMSAGYLYAVGDEDEHFAAAKAAVDKPENVLAIAAAIQRGTAAGYTSRCCKIPNVAAEVRIDPDQCAGRAVGNDERT